MCKVKQAKKMMKVAQNSGKPELARIWKQIMLQREKQ